MGQRMNTSRPLLSICIPAYNRARHLSPLLESIFSQEFGDYEVVICEDNSAERADIERIVGEYADRYPGYIAYHPNPVNLGYDANIRNLVAHARGHFCMFMGNDDLMCPSALSTVARIISGRDNVGVVLKSYAWFDESPERVNQAVRYFAEERYFREGRDAIRVCYRRSGVISGYIVHRDSAHLAATDAFDGTLYYQMHLTASVLSNKCAVATPSILVLCRSGEPPDFGNSEKERGRYEPGRYTPEARIHMVSGSLAIIRNLKAAGGLDVVDDVLRDYASYFYPYVRDQLHLPFREFVTLYWRYGDMGFRRYPLFHIYCMVAYVLGPKHCDYITRFIRGVLGRSPQFGGIGD
jgi:abequosyltransferase